MSNHSTDHIRHPHRQRTISMPSPWALIPAMLGWIVVGFIALFVIMFLLALVGIS